MNLGSHRTYKPDFEQGGHVQPTLGRPDVGEVGYLKDVLQRLPTQPASALADLLPYRWKPGA